LVRFSQKKVYGKRRFGQFEIAVALGKVKGSLGLRSKTEEGIFLVVSDQGGDSCFLAGMNALDFCKAVLNQANTKKEILEKYAKGKSAGSFVLVQAVSLDSRAAFDLTRYLVGILSGLKEDSIGTRSYISRAKALLPSLQRAEATLKKMSREKPFQVKEDDSALSEKEIEALANKEYSLIRGIEKVASPRALLHDLEFIQAKLREAERQENVGQ
jgi:hypothetical protein